MGMRILHLFNWKLKDIDPYLVKEQGFGAIQISPLQPMKQNEFVWWVLYQPCGFTIGNNFIGSKEDLINLCNRSKKAGVKIIADVILDHVAGRNFGDNLEPHEKVDIQLRKMKNIWKPKVVCENPDDRYQATHFTMGTPGLITRNKELQEIIIKFLLELIECGVSGFRFDAGKHIALPSEGNDFWEVINEKLPKDLFNYAEVIMADKELLTEFSKYVNVLTDGSIDDKNKMVTFVETHDTLLHFKYTAKMTDDMLLKEYEILTDNFPNTLFLARPYSNLWKDERMKKINLK